MTYTVFYSLFYYGSSSYTLQLKDLNLKRLSFCFLFKLLMKMRGSWPCDEMIKNESPIDCVSLNGRDDPRFFSLEKPDGFIWRQIIELGFEAHRSNHLFSFLDKTVRSILKCFINLKLLMNALQSLVTMAVLGLVAQLPLGFIFSVILHFSH